MEEDQIECGHFGSCEIHGSGLDKAIAEDVRFDSAKNDEKETV